jgi:5-methylcytosine-specific restriction protein A
MPQRLKRPCNHPGCPALTDNRYCDQHRKQEMRRYDQDRGTRQERGYTAQWLKVREIYLRRHPLCERCEDAGRVEVAAMVHHKQAIRQGGAVLNMENLQAVCRRCHDAIHGGGTGGAGN